MNIIKRIIDWKRQYIQIILFLLIVIFFIKIDVIRTIDLILSATNIKRNELPIYLRIIISHGKWVLLVVVICALWIIMNKINKKEILNLDNNMYHDHIF